MPVLEQPSDETVWPDLEQPSKEVVSSVLSFYGSQLTSHASMIVGFIVAFFTLVQARASILAIGVPPWEFEFVAFAVISAVVYSVFRVALYGSLSGVLMHVSMNQYSKFLETETVGLFDHAMVDKFASDQLITYSRARRFLYERRGYKSKRAGRWVSDIIQPPMIFSFVIASIFASILFGWSLEWLLVLDLFAGFVVLADVSLTPAVAVHQSKLPPS
jgi:hypothetical protein